MRVLQRRRVTILGRPVPSWPGVAARERDTRREYARDHHACATPLRQNRTTQESAAVVMRAQRDHSTRFLARGLREHPGCRSGSGVRPEQRALTPSNAWNASSGRLRHHRPARIHSQAVLRCVAAEVTGTTLSAKPGADTSTMSCG